MVTVFSPAKINLFLAVTGRRADGFHDLVSLAAPLDFGDELRVELRGEGHDAGAGRFTLECDNPAVPTDGSNLILKAAEMFAAATGWTGRVHFRLTKRIPMGAGLGGGSSNAVAALRAMNQLAGGQLGEELLAGLAAGIGSDCALFLSQAPVVMRGRGERVEPLSATATRRLKGRRVLVFKPSFGISTPWAYGRMVARATDYLPASEAELRLARWVKGDAELGELLFNNMQPAAFEKYAALPVLLEQLRDRTGMSVLMSGSGSACYAIPSKDGSGGTQMQQARALVRAAWGEAAFLVEAQLS